MIAKLVFSLLCVLCLTPYLSTGLALLLGVTFALCLGNPFLEKSRIFTPKLLSYSIVGLGAGMNLGIIAKVGVHGIGYTALGIGLTFLLGTALHRILGTEAKISKLIISGTAICGGSAIAAITPVIGASAMEASVALGTVFILNAVALFVFPPLGHFFHLSEVQFGLWSALAIHDTSSVVGASLQYGPVALQTATTIKLARALWIIPLAIAFASLEKSKQSGVSAKKPWFILGFILAAALVTFIPSLQGIGQHVAAAAKHLFVLVLFLIGSQLSKKTIQSVGPKPFIQGFLLWILVASGTLAAILMGWIN